VAEYLAFGKHAGKHLQRLQRAAPVAFHRRTVSKATGEIVSGERCSTKLTTLVRAFHDVSHGMDPQVIRWLKLGPPHAKRELGIEADVNASRDSAPVAC